MAADDDRGWLLTHEATARLGVKPQTLYAYVSRGLIRSEHVRGTRTSRFRREDVERLALRARRTTHADGPPGGLDVVIDTELTLLDPAGALAYRGWDAVDAARRDLRDRRRVALDRRARDRATHVAGAPTRRCAWDRRCSAHSPTARPCPSGSG